MNGGRRDGRYRIFNARQVGAQCLCERENPRLLYSVFLTSNNESCSLIPERTYIIYVLSTPAIKVGAARGAEESPRWRPGQRRADLRLQGSSPPRQPITTSRTPSEGEGEGSIGAPAGSSGTHTLLRRNRPRTATSDTFDVSNFRGRREATGNRLKADDARAIGRPPTPSSPVPSQPSRAGEAGACGLAWPPAG